MTKEELSQLEERVATGRRLLGHIGDLHQAAADVANAKNIGLDAVNETIAVVALGEEAVKDVLLPQAEAKALLPLLRATVAGVILDRAKAVEDEFAAL